MDSSTFLYFKYFLFYADVQNVHNSKYLRGRRVTSSTNPNSVIPTLISFWKVFRVGAKEEREPAHFRGKKVVCLFGGGLLELPCPPPDTKIIFRTAETLIQMPFIVYEMEGIDTAFKSDV